jgi:hypothetical protein
MKNKTKSVRRKAVSTVKKAQASKPEGCIYSDPRHDQQVSLSRSARPEPAEELREKSRHPGRVVTPRPTRGNCWQAHSPGPPHDVIPRGHPEMNHGVRCGPTMFTKQVSRPVDGLDPEGCIYSDHAADVGFAPSARHGAGPRAHDLTGSTSRPLARHAIQDLSACPSRTGPRMLPTQCQEDGTEFWDPHTFPALEARYPSSYRSPGVTTVRRF